MANKTRNVASQLVLQQCFKTNCTFLLPVLPHLEPNLFAAYVYIWHIFNAYLVSYKVFYKLPKQTPLQNAGLFTTLIKSCVRQLFSSKLRKSAVQRVKKILACSRLPESGEKSFSKKKCEKRAETGERQPFFPPPLPPLPSRPRPIFALLLLKRPHFTI